MKSRTSFLLSTLLAAGLPLAALPAAASPQTYGGPSHPDKMIGQHGMMHGGRHWTGKNVIEGNTKNINHDTGVMYLMAEGRELKLHFPPQALNKVETGDHVVVELAYSDLTRMHHQSGMNGQSSTGYGSSGMKNQNGMRMSGSKMHHDQEGDSYGMQRGGWIGEHTMTGTVTEVQRTAGVVDLKTAEGVLSLRFPASSLPKVHQGDKLAVYLALKKG